MNASLFFLQPKCHAVRLIAPSPGASSHATSNTGVCSACAHCFSRHCPGLHLPRPATELQPLLEAQRQCPRCPQFSSTARQARPGCRSVYVQCAAAHVCVDSPNWLLCQVRERLASRTDLRVVSLPDALRKDDAARKDALNSADAVILCLPDDAAIAAVQLLEPSNTRTVVVDASTAFRTAEGTVTVSCAHEALSAENYMLCVRLGVRVPRAVPRAALTYCVQQAYQQPRVLSNWLRGPHPATRRRGNPAQGQCFDGARRVGLLWWRQGPHQGV
jgi:hypothetical protein